MKFLAFIFALITLTNQLNAMACDNVFIDREREIARKLQDAVDKGELTGLFHDGETAPFFFVSAREHLADFYKTTYATSSTRMLVSNMIVFRDGDKYFTVISNLYFEDDQEAIAAVVAGTEIFESGTINALVNFQFLPGTDHVSFNTFTASPLDRAHEPYDPDLRQIIYEELVRFCLPEGHKEAVIDLSSPSGI